MQALILAGGSGTRFWPASRQARPKQFLTLAGDRSLLQNTVSRLHPLLEPEDVWICTTRALAGEVARQVPDVPPHQILSEPQGRNTAAAIGWSIQCMPEELQQGVVAVLPSDHRVGQPEAFRQTLKQAALAVTRGERVMTLGVMPSRPETGYGYLETGKILDSELGMLQVERFTEKPDAETAVRFVEEGRYFWNAGIFVFRGSSMLQHIATYEPDLGRGLAEILRQPEQLDELYAELPSISIDYAVMERLPELATLPLDCDWSDVGSWTALADILAPDESGNARQGDVLAVDSQDNVLFADEGHIAVLGVSDLIVVRTADAVLVVPKKNAQEVRRLVERLHNDGRSDLL